MEKIYFSIGETVKLTGIGESLLRKWEEEFPLLNPKRTERGLRRYTKQDIDLINTIKTLRDVQHLDYEGIRQQLKNKRDEAQRKALVIARLKAIRKELVAIRHDLNFSPAWEQDIIIDNNEKNNS